MVRGQCSGLWPAYRLTKEGFHPFAVSSAKKLILDGQTLRMSQHEPICASIEGSPTPGAGMEIASRTDGQSGIRVRCDAGCGGYVRSLDSNGAERLSETADDGKG
jgi:hypothetical protein